MVFLLAFFNVNQTFTEGEGKREVAKAEIEVRARLISPFKVTEGDDPQEIKENNKVDEMPVTFSEKIDNKNNTHTIIFE